jgi:hypothetical protein
MWGDCHFDQVEHGAEVDRQGSVPFGVGDVFDCMMGRLHGGVVDEHIDAAEFVDSGGDGDTTVGRSARSGEQNGFPVCLFDPGLCVFGIVMFIEVRDQQVGTPSSVGDGDRFADAAVTAGDDRPFARQAAGPWVGLFAVIGLRHQLAFAAGNLLLRWTESLTSP